ncbi:hypothetical protein BD779DRAFT_1542858 [Infundibulicybe gibba]|nr:hypothetical protein BD779DRAFT_1567658 [Infundibulicybe gibba]KAF8882386.1 hypothetical protein BD779DRAFT_1542858 [Infundibulicybe gibba]
MLLNLFFFLALTFIVFVQFDEQARKSPVLLAEAAETWFRPGDSNDLRRLIAFICECPSQAIPTHLECFQTLASLRNA